MQTGCEKLMDELAALHMEDYGPVLLNFIPVLDLAATVQSYCLDEMAFETDLFRRVDKYSGIFCLTERYLNLKHTGAKKWSECAYQLCAGHMFNFYNQKPENVTPERIWYRMLSPSMHRTDMPTNCIRPQCFWRRPPECICGQPLPMYTDDVRDIQRLQPLLPCCI